MYERRSVLLRGAAFLVATSTGIAAQARESAALQSLQGTWKVSAVPEASTPSDLARFKRSSETSVQFTLQGEVGKALGGAVELHGEGTGKVTGTSKTGVVVTLAPLASNRWSLTLQGNGLYFALFLVR